MLAEVGRVGVAPTVFLMYLIKSQVLKCRPRLTIPMKKETSPCEYGLATYYCQLPVFFNPLSKSILIPHRDLASR